MAGGPVATGRASTPEQQAPASRQERLTSAESYLPLPTFSISVLPRQSTQGMLVVDMGLDVQDVALRRRALANLPRLQDAIRTSLVIYANAFYRDRTAPDPGQITRLTQQAVDRTLGSSGVQPLLANIIYQRRRT